jgi:hypothetical protein
MLSQIVRPMVNTQLRLLAKSQATRPTLVSTVAQWLGFLGVRAHVTQLDASSGKINISLTVDKPEACDDHDWQQIVKNLETPNGNLQMPLLADLTPQQQSKLQRLLAYVLQAGNPGQPVNWEDVYPQLQPLGLDETILLGIRSALKIPQDLESLLNDLDPDVAAIALPKAVSIAMLDHKVNQSEDAALTSLLNAMKEGAC